MTPLSHLESSIPVLTEIISVEDAAPSPPVNPIPFAVTDNPIQTQAPAMTDQALEQFEKTLRENVLRQLLTRVDFVLEHRVRDSLADVLQTAVDQLAADIRGGLVKSLEEVIERTVSQEISKIQSANIKT